MSMLSQKNRLVTRTLLAFLLVFVLSSASARDSEDTPVNAGNTPEATTDDAGSNKDVKCLTVCARWGEDCMINPRTGSRKCRRVCKEFGKECFDPSMPQLNP